MRKFKELKPYFIRCSFLDNDWNWTRNMEYVTNTLFKKLLD